MAKLLIINETNKKKPQIQRILKLIQAKILFEPDKCEKKLYTQSEKICFDILFQNNQIFNYR